MCGQFVMVPKEVVDEIIQEILDKSFNAARAGVSSGRLVPPDEPAHPDEPAQQQIVFPEAQVPLIVLDAGKPKTEVMTWGYQVSWSKKVLFNTRFDTATKPGRTVWSESLALRRCLVPTFGFYESHQSETFVNLHTGKENKQKYFFTNPDSKLLYLAGVYQEGRFSVMTTDPNQQMQPIHNRMPVVLQHDEIDTWLQGDYLSLADRSSVRLLVQKA